MPAPLAPFATIVSAMLLAGTSAPSGSAPPASSPPNAAAPQVGASTGAVTPATREPIPPNLLKPIPATGGVPLMVARDDRDGNLFAPRPEQRDDVQRLTALVNRYFRTQRPAVREAGYAEIRRFIDPSSFRPMIDVLLREDADVRRVLFAHFAESGEAGQAALAYIAITEKDRNLRHAAAERIRRPACDSVLRLLDEALRETKHDVVNNAGRLAGNLNITAAIPAMIFGQVVDDAVGQDGDMAWIAIGTTKSYVANVIPIVGDNSGAYAPVIDQIFEGVVFRVQNAVAYSYRTDLHHALVAMTSADMGESTEYLGYDMRGWWKWFNEQYVPFKQRQAEEIARIEQVDRQREVQTKPSSAPPPPPEAPAPKAPE